MITFKSFYYSAKVLLDQCMLCGESKATAAEKKKYIDE